MYSKTITVIEINDVFLYESLCQLLLSVLDAPVQEHCDSTTARVLREIETCLRSLSLQVVRGTLELH